MQTAGTATSVKIVNSTISGNTASTPGNGAGGIGTYGNVAIEIDNSTIANNAAQGGAPGGIMLDTGPTFPASASDALPPSLTLKSTIVAASASGAPDIGINELTLPSFIVAASQALVGRVEAGITIAGSGNKIGVGPALGPLSFNGGATRTHPLLLQSPAIDAGSNPLGLATDQRGSGFPRVIGGTADMGAY